MELSNSSLTIGERPGHHVMHVLGQQAVQYLAPSLFVCLWALLLCIPVCALDRDRKITQFHHTAWTAKDGAPSQITTLTQTQDGYLWIGSQRGLFRFDGVQFEPFQPPPGVSLPSHSINSLMATPDGGLWISFNPSGLAFLKDGAISIFDLPKDLPVSELVCFARDFDGRVWAGARTGLVVFDGSRWVNTASDFGFANRRVWTMFVDRDGTLWIAVDNTIVFLPRGSGKFQETGLQLNGVVRMGQAKDGRLWMTEWFQPIRPVPKSGGRSFAPEDPLIRVNAYKFLFDREGSLWLTAGGPDGIRRVRFPERLGNRKLEANDPELESFTADDGLTDNSANTFLEDREGNIWVSSNKGLDRFRHSHLVPVTLPSGHRDLTLLAGSGGEVWVASGSSQPLLRIRGEEIVTRNVPMEISSVCQDSKGVVWWGAQGGMWRQQNELFEFFREPKNANLDWFWEVSPSDSDGGLWAGVGDVGVFHFKDRSWTNRPRPAGLLDRVPSASYRDPTGRIWFGYTENRVYTLAGEHVQAYSSADGIDIGRIRVIRGRGPLFWFGGELGLAVFSSGRFKTIRMSGGEPFGTVSGIVETPDGALWLNNLHGVVRISPEEVRQLVADPDHEVIYQTFDFLDGLPGAPQMNFRSSTAIEATDGRLWFATDNGLAWIDPARISKNMVPPPVTIRFLDTGRKYEPSAALNLPAGTQRLRIEYAALSLSVPERVRFRYMLEGADKDWQDSGNQRQASYTNLGPGKYVFRVIASNNDGVWNDQGATLSFSIAPAWYQTNWFRVLCVFALLLLAWAIYRLHVRQIAGDISARFDERLAERTRLARELHDTFLQTIQGSKMVADDALDGPSDPARLRRAIKQLSSWLAQATDEGRAALNSLRTSTTEKNDLADAFRRATEGALVPSSMTVALNIAGEPKEMHPIVRDEVYRIGYEAIRNSFVHSKASRLEVELKYGHDLSVRVSDNGVGVDADVLDRGKSGHFGLKGMRERADRIGAKFTVVSSAANGTEITLVIPGKIVFRKPSRR